ncbi:MAG: glycosyltransferase family 4 protein [Rubrivivax sp.]
MRVLIVHNAYQQRGGEDAVVEAEIELLRAGGVDVRAYTRHNDELREQGRLRSAVDALWSRRTTQEVGEVLREWQPDLVHLHNTFPMISPSVAWSASRARVPVVQTLHNFRLACLQGTMLRDEQPCTRCLGKLPLPGVVHGCYRGSRTQSAVLAASLILHRSLGTWRTKVDRFIALTAFCRDRLVEGGLDASRIVVQPNFADVPAQIPAPRQGLLYVGRLSHEKGIGVLAGASQGLYAQSLLVAGAGPLAGLLENSPACRMLGHLDPAGVTARMARSVALVLPSTCFEGFPRALVEAYACSLPVIASRLGSLEELVQDGETGLLVDPGDAVALAEAMRWALAHPERMAQMGQAARARYERHFTPQRALDRRLALYAELLASNAA